MRIGTTTTLAFSGNIQCTAPKDGIVVPIAHILEVRISPVNIEICPATIYCLHCVVGSCVSVFVYVCCVSVRAFVRACYLLIHNRVCCMFLYSN